MVFYFKIRSLLGYIFSFIFLIAANLCVAIPTQPTTTPLARFSVVIDAGHGGVDTGAVSKSGANERDINLAIAQKLGKMLLNLQIQTIYTRTTKDALYNDFTRGHKLKDMEKRAEVIKKANPNLVISIHLNSFPSQSAHGAQVFFKPKDNSSQELAQNLQELFVKNIEGSRNTAQEGDFYILNCSPSTAILVECGFLSNPDEEQKLKSDSYQEKLAYTIMCGVVSFFGLNEN